MNTDGTYKLVAIPYDCTSVRLKPGGKPIYRVKARRGLRWRVSGEGITRRTVIELPPHEDTPPSPAVRERIDAIVASVHRSDEMYMRRVPRWEGMP